MLYCHHCRQKRPENIIKACSNLVDPKGVPCSKRYCRMCFERFYPGLYESLSTTAFTCPYCCDYCCCTRCNNKKYPLYPPKLSEEGRFPLNENTSLLNQHHAVPSYSHKHDAKESLPSESFISTMLPYRVPVHPKKAKKSTKNSEPAEADPAWAELSLKYLQYAKRLAEHSNIPVSNVRQLPSITHMIAISSQGLDEAPWRWCDAYHAIKYLKDHNMVSTSRGAKGTSVKEEQHTIDDLIQKLQVQINTNQQGQMKNPSPLRDAKVKVNLQHPLKPTGLIFMMPIGDLVKPNDCNNGSHNIDLLYQRVKHMLADMHEDNWVCEATTVRLDGYLEKETGDYIHANKFTSIPELVQDAAELYIICS